MSASVILPVGRPGGVFGTESQSHGLIRYGAAPVRVDGASYRLWRVAAAGRSEDDLLDWADTHAVPDAQVTVDSLRENSLLIDAPLERPMASALALHLVGELLGSSTAGPGSDFVVQGRDGQALAVGPIVYEALLRSGPHVSIAAIGAIVDASMSGSDAVGAILNSVVALVRAEVVVMDGVIL